MKHLGWLVVVAACAHNVPQDKATGPDGKLKGASPLIFGDAGQARARGIVTYPGGDRVDWKKIEIEKGTPVRLDLKLSWQAPRPGLQVAMDVFDAWGVPVVNASGNRRGRTRTATIDNAHGTYFVRIYAPRRGDAGAYQLLAELIRREDPDGERKRLRDALRQIPDPPRLAGVPEVEPECFPFDVANRACAKVCPGFGAPQGWPPCAEKERLEKEKAERELAEKNKPPPPKPVIARILHVETVADSRRITLGVGTDHAPIDASWTAEVLSSQTGKPITGQAGEAASGGNVILVRVGKTQTLAKSLLTLDQLTANPQVRLSPPSKP
jgi:hypothetical protein